MRLLLLLYLVVGCSTMAVETFAYSLVTGPVENPVLYAGFDNKTPGEPIDTRGAAFGEPSSLGYLDAVVAEHVPGDNMLRISNPLTSSTARRTRWQVMGDTELNEGLVSISLDFTASALDRYSVLVRESNSSSKAFMTIALDEGGTLRVSDASGAAYLTRSNAYAPNARLHMELVFDMDARTSSIYLNGSAVSTGRAHGISDRGIGGVLVGYNSGASGSSFDLDNLAIAGTLPFPVVLDAEFDDKTAGTLIGLGGAEVNEPTSKSPNMNAIVVNPIGAINILAMTSANNSTAQYLRWEFLDNLEIRSGFYVMDFQLALMTHDQYGITMREPSTSAQSFMNLNFSSAGSVTVTDKNGTASLSAASYQPGQIYSYRIIHYLDSGIYDIFRDGHPLLRERAHGVSARGIGAVLNVLQHGVTQNTAQMQLDSLRVYASDAAVIPARLEFLQEATTAVIGESVTPVIEVSVKNYLGEAVPDGTLVTLEISPGSGPPSATLHDATGLTDAGVASFPDLRFDTPGTYRLLARSLDARVLGNVDIVVALENEGVLFSDGFEENE